MPEERKEFQEMFSELNMYEKRGVYIAMEGKPASPDTDRTGAYGE